MMSLQIYLSSNEATLPVKISSGAAGYNIHSAEDNYVRVHHTVAVSTKIHLAIPHGYYGRVAPFAKLAFCHRLDVLGGVIDADDRSEVKVLLFNHSNKDYFIKQGDLIAQLIIERIAEDMEVRTVGDMDCLDATNTDSDLSYSEILPLR